MKVEYRHTPVMLRECQEYLAPQPGDIFCDCTLGGAGHSLALGKDLLPDGLAIGIDQDTMALDAASLALKASVPNLDFVGLHGNFLDLDELLTSIPVAGVDAFLFDLGVSSPQLDIPDRGFSYARSAPLDMRMDPSKQTKTAAEIINTLNETDLARIIREYGEERWALRIATFIVKRRQIKAITTTDDLVDIIKAAIPAGARRSGGNPSKRTFQALRIAVNDEIEALKTGLEAALRWLNPLGRIAVISYHSLEDRIVKDCFAQAAQGCTCLPQTPICICGKKPIIERVTKKPIYATDEELALNPRAKSAKLRVAKKLNL